MNNVSPTMVSLDTPAEMVLEADYRDWIALLKPRVLTLVVFTGVIGLLLAPGAGVHRDPVHHRRGRRVRCD